MATQYSCLRNSMDRGAWRVTVHGVAKKVGHDLVTKQQQHQQLLFKKKKKENFKMVTADHQTLWETCLSLKSHVLPAQITRPGAGCGWKAPLSVVPDLRVRF